MASTKQVCHEKPKHSFAVWEDCTLTDVEVQDVAADQPVPMFLEQTEEVVNEKEQMEEVEMEDIFEEPVMDIDGCDEMNALATVDYVQDLYAYYRKMEIQHINGLPKDWEEKMDNVHQLFSKVPHYDNASKQYELDFREKGRSGLKIQSSVKNFQLTLEKNGRQTILQLGRVSKSKYVMDYGFSFC